MFIVFEGPDGAGKSTQVELLTQALRARSIPAIAVPEPGGTSVGEAVREIMFGEPPFPMRPLTWAFLMNAARSELVDTVIRPSILRGMVVIADRYWYSTLAYQGAGEGLDSTIIRDLSAIAISGLEPEMVLYLDVSSAGIERKRTGSLNVLDRRPLEFHKRVVACYREMAGGDPERWVVRGRHAADRLSCCRGP